MKHTCEHCSTRYELPDDRVRGRVLKVRCRTCTCVMRVTGSQGRAGWWVALHGAPAGPYTRAEVLALVDDGAIGARTRMWRAGMVGWERVLEHEQLGFVYERLLQRGGPADDAALVDDGHGYFPDPTMKSGFIVLDDATQVRIAALARKHGLAPRRAQAPLYAPALAAALGAICAVTGFVWMLALPTG